MAEENNHLEHESFQKGGTVVVLLDGGFSSSQLLSGVRQEQQFDANVGSTGRRWTAHSGGSEHFDG